MIDFNNAPEQLDKQPHPSMFDFNDAGRQADEQPKPHVGPGDEPKRHDGEPNLKSLCRMCSCRKKDNENFTYASVR